MILKGFAELRLEKMMELLDSFIADFQYWSY